MTEEKLAKLCSEMTLDEKLGMLHGNELFRTKGVERLGIPAFTFSDGPMGVRPEYEKTKWFLMNNSSDFTSYLPSNTALAATWNRSLAYETGKALGKETRGRGKDMILAPGINIQRSPLNGRNFEYMGEDPYLTSEMVVPLIQGIEENDVAACVKHYALNNQETKRLSVNVELDDRTLHEIYLPGFKAAVQKGKSKGIMGSYNRYENQQCCHNKKLLQNILRDDWGFTGVVVSDWGGVHDTKEAAENGLDMEMSVTDNFSEYYMADPLKKMIESGEVSEKRVDEKIMNILHMMNDLHMLDGERKRGFYNDLDDRKNYLQVARESVVLLKNENHILPITRQKGMKILVVGENADRRQCSGGGSAEIKALYEISPLLGISMIAGGDVEVTYSKGYEAFSSCNIWDEEHKEKEQSWQATSLAENPERADYIEQLTPEQEAQNRESSAAAIRAAKDADYVIYVGGYNHEQDTEGKDRLNMTLPYHQDELIQGLLKANKNTIVVMMSGSPVDMNAWKNQAPAIVQYWFSGMEGGRAVAEVLFGDVCPSGRLPETFPVQLSDIAAFTVGEFPGGESVKYSEGVFVGYRDYETNHKTVNYPFGYGLSYTDFAYSLMKQENLFTQDGMKCVIRVQVTNTGKMAGAETVQLYVHADESHVERPISELRAFEKVFLQPGETKEVVLELGAEAFTYYDTFRGCFVAEKGGYTLSLRKNAHDMIQEMPLELPREYTVAR